MSQTSSITDLILKNANLLFFGLNQQGVITLTNSKCREILGYEFEEMEFHPLLNLLQAPPEGGVESFLKRNMETPEIISFVTRDGRELKLLATTAHLKDSPTPHLHYISYLTVLPDNLNQIVTEHHPLKTASLEIEDISSPAEEPTSEPSISVEPDKPPVTPETPWAAASKIAPTPVLEPFSSTIELEMPEDDEDKDDNDDKDDKDDKDEITVREQPQVSPTVQPATTDIVENSDEPGGDLKPYQESSPPPEDRLQAFESENREMDSWFWIPQIAAAPPETFFPFKFRYSSQIKVGKSDDASSNASSNASSTSLPNPLNEVGAVAQNALIYDESMPTQSEAGSLDIVRALKDLRFFQSEGKRSLYQTLGFIEKILVKANQTISSKGQYLVNASEGIRDPRAREMKNAVKSMFSSLRSLKRMINSIERIAANRECEKKVSISFSEMYQQIMPILEKEMSVKNIVLHDETKDFLYIANETEWKYIFVTIIDIVLGFSRDNGVVRIVDEQNHGLREISIITEKHFYENNTSIYEQLLIDKKLDMNFATMIAQYYGIRIQHGITNDHFYIKLVLSDY